MRIPKIITYLAITVLLLTSCGVVGEIGYSPPGIPIKVSVNSEGNVNLSASHSVTTPIGTFSLGGGRTIYSLRDESDKRLLVVRVGTVASVYELEEGKEFRITFEENSRFYRKVALEYESDGDIILELEPVSAVDPNVQYNVSFHLNELTKHVETHTFSDNPYYVIQLEIDEGRTHSFRGSETVSISLYPGQHTWRAYVEGWDDDIAIIGFEGSGTFEVYDDCDFWLETGHGRGLLGMPEEIVVLKPN